MTERLYPRFSLGQRAQHGVLLVSFTTLALTGLPQTFAGTAVGEGMIALLGGIEAVRLVHRAAAVLLMATTIWHLIGVGYRVLVLRQPLTMLTRFMDLRDFWHTVRYNLGRGAERPSLGRYTFEEKVEYWALLWGTAVMVLTGFMLWNPIATARLVPGQAIPAAQIAHGGEALLAVLAVIVWHGYGVHLRHFNRSMFTGTMTEEEMRHEHPRELEEILAGKRPPEPEAALLRRRRRVFSGVAAVLWLVLAAALYWFVTFEETAIPTVRPSSGPPASSAPG